MKCRYCGRDIKPLADTLRSQYGEKCDTSPTGRHIAMSDGAICVYCGRQTKPMSGKLRTQYGDKCKNSPTGYHALQ